MTQFSYFWFLDIQFLDTSVVSHLYITFFRAYRKAKGAVSLEDPSVSAKVGCSVYLLYRLPKGESVYSFCPCTFRILIISLFVLSVFLPFFLFFFFSLCVRTFWEPWLNNQSINFSMEWNSNFLNIRARKILKTVLEISDQTWAIYIFNFYNFYRFRRVPPLTGPKL